AWEAKAHAFGCVWIRGFQDHHVIAFRDRWEVAIHQGHVVQNALRLQAIQPVAQAWSAFSCHQILVAWTLVAAAGFQTPRPHEQGALSKVAQELRQGQTLDNAGSPERWCRGWSIGGDIRTLRNNHRSRISFTLRGNLAGTLITSLTFRLLLRLLNSFW